MKILRADIILKNNIIKQMNENKRISLYNLFLIKKKKKLKIVMNVIL